LEELVAREAVRDLIARYNANGDAGRFDEVLELFVPDAVLELPDATYEGRDAIAGMFHDVQRVVLDDAPAGAKPYIRHLTATLQIDLDGPDRAGSRCYYQVLGPSGLDHWGRYVDEFERRDGAWRFARRRVSVDGFRSGSAFDT
jgi:hypothetical protein